MCSVSVIPLADMDDSSTMELVNVMKGENMILEITFHRFGYFDRSSAKSNRFRWVKLTSH